MYMRKKLHIGDSNPDPFLTHPTNTYTCRVNNTPKMCSGKLNSLYVNCYFYMIV